MEFLEKNLAMFQEHYPKYYETLKEALEEGKYSFENLEVVETRDGNQALVINKDENVIRLNSVYRPFAETKKWADQYEFQNMEISVLMFGIGNGYFAREMVSRLQGDALVYLYEPDMEIFLFALHHFDFTDIFMDNRVLFFVEGMNEEIFQHEFSKRLHWSAIPTQIHCEHPGYKELYREKYVWFTAIIKKEDEIELVNRNTMAAMSHNIPENVIRNLHFIKESNYSTEFIDDIPDEVPVIIVSAGPSLDKNMEELRRAKGKALILATDTAVKYLVAKDIPFDAMVSIDSKKTIKHLQDEKCANVPLFCVPEARNIIMERHTGRKIWFEGMYYIENLYKKFNRIFPQYNTGGSVATAAMMLGIALGFKRFVLIGQDLAYGDGATHAGGVVKKIRSEEEGMEMVEGIDGNMIKSRYDWVIYRDWFEKVIEAKKDIEVIDATEGGALIHGSTIMTFADVIDRYCHNAFDFAEILENKPYTFVGTEYEEVKKAVFHLKKDLNNVKQKSMEGIKVVKEFILKTQMDKNTPDLEAKLLKKIQKANNFIEKQDLYELLDPYISDRITEAIQGINCVTGDEKQDLIATLETSKVVFEALYDATNELEPILEEALAKM